jgi:1,4-dihydroxy-2-naphthoate octaprenyltransferase
MKVLRSNLWWHAIVPQVLAWVYFSLLSLQVYANQTGAPLGQGIFGILHRFIPFFVTLVSLSSFGYLLNDFCDIESDTRAGKKNLLASLPPMLSIFLILASLAIAILGWLRQFGGQAFGHKLIPSVLFLLQLALLIAYSMKPFRLKERGLAGVLADAVYGHLNPALITIFTLFGFRIFEAKDIFFKSMLLLSVTLLWFIKGIRNILMHQLEDRKRDRKARTQTFVVQHHALAVFNFINRVLIPVEAAILLLFVLEVSYVIPPFIFSFILFAIVSYLKFSGWKLAYLPKRQLRFKFLYFLNDYYEKWFPVWLLIIFSVYNHWALILLSLHLLCFPSFVTDLWADMKTIRQNFKTEEDY